MKPIPNGKKSSNPFSIIFSLYRGKKIVYYFPLKRDKNEKRDI
jgi:hypothetical protein